MYLHALSKNKLTALLKHYRGNGVCARVHKLSKKVPKKALAFDETKHVVSFIVNYADAHAMSLPGRVPGYARDDLKLLPSSCSNDYYVGTCKVTDNRVCSLVLFRRLWRQLVPFIVTMKPRTDLCWFYQQNVTMISRVINLSDEEKAEAFPKAEIHLATAKCEREFYHGVSGRAKHDAGDIEALLPKQPLSFDGLGHYSMDFAQQVHFPSNSLQPSPIYFKTPRKCWILE